MKSITLLQILSQHAKGTQVSASTTFGSNITLSHGVFVLLLLGSLDGCLQRKTMSARGVQNAHVALSLHINKCLLHAYFYFPSDI